MSGILSLWPIGVVWLVFGVTIGGMYLVERWRRQRATQQFHALLDAGLLRLTQQRPDPVTLAAVAVMIADHRRQIAEDIAAAIERGRDQHVPAATSHVELAMRSVWCKAARIARENKQVDRRLEEVAR
jgi:hypothetical protein